MVFGLFKKKKREELKEIPNSNLQTSTLPDLNNQQQFQPYQSYNPEMQLIISKLELINARLQNIEQRLLNIERIAKESEKQEVKRW